MKTNKKKIGIEILLVIFILFLSSCGHSFSVGSPYYKDEFPLKLPPGATESISFSLQNTAGNENITVKAVVSSGFEIINLTDPSDIYVVSPGGVETIVSAKVTVPENAEIGDVYNIVVDFVTVTKSGKQGVSLGSAIERAFNVVVIEKPKLPEKPKPKISTTLIIIMIIIAIVIVASISKKEKIKKIFLKKK